MCLYPKRMINKKYTATEKNQGCVPSLPIVGYSKNESYDIIDEETGEITRVTRGATPIVDNRVQYIEVPCGQCQECRKTKARQWQVRLNEEIKDWNYKYFVTFTFSPEGLREICLKKRIKESNAAAAYALRHCLERWRKDKKKALRHWFITELGHEGTERIHMHGLILTDEQLQFEELERKHNGIMAKWKYWKYGIIFVGDYVNAKSVNYIVKYMEKIDNDHKGFIGQVLCSPGIGRRYIDHLKEIGSTEYKYRPRDTKGYYRLNNGARVKLPTYYKNKLQNEEERELIWREFMDLQKITISGNTYNQSQKGLQGIINKAQEVNSFLGYGSDSKEWRKRDYNITRRMLMDVERLKQKRKMLDSLIQKNPENEEYKENLKKIKEKLAQFK